MKWRNECQSVSKGEKLKQLSRGPVSGLISILFYWFRINRELYSARTYQLPPSKLSEMVWSPGNRLHLPLWTSCLDVIIIFKLW